VITRRLTANVRLLSVAHAQVAVCSCLVAAPQKAHLYDLPEATHVSPIPEVPSLFCTVMLVPLEKPKLLGSNKGDGPAMHLFYVQQLTEESVRILKVNSFSPPPHHHFNPGFCSCIRLPNKQLTGFSRAKVSQGLRFLKG
jgi:hypothetical protein